MQSKYHCRNCKGLRNYTIVCEKKTNGEDYLRWIENYYIIQCAGCETLSFLKIYGDEMMMEYDDEGNAIHSTEDIVYPHYLNSGIEIEQAYHLPERIRNIYGETISALKIGAPVLAAAGFRAVIEAVCIKLNIQSKSLSKSIDLLSEKGHLTAGESKRLHSIRFMGNNALHEIETPKKRTVNCAIRNYQSFAREPFYTRQKVGTYDRYTH
jgi:hypothetical protein